MIEDEEPDLEREKERMLHLCEAEEQALIYTTDPGVYRPDPHCKDLFHASVSERPIYI